MTVVTFDPESLFLQLHVHFETSDDLGTGGGLYCARGPAQYVLVQLRYRSRTAKRGKKASVFLSYEEARELAAQLSKLTSGKSRAQQIEELRAQFSPTAPKSEA